MAPKVHEITRDELTARRARLLHEVGLTEQELQERAASYSLTDRGPQPG